MYELKNLEKYASLVAEETGKAIESVKSDMENAHRKYRITPRRYYLSKMYDKTDIRMARITLSQKRREQRREMVFDEIEADSDISRKVAKKRFESVEKIVNDKDFSLDDFFMLELYKHDPKKNRIKVELILAKRKKLLKIKETIQAKLNDIESGKASYSGLQTYIDKYIQLLEKTLNPKTIEQSINAVAIAKPEILKGSWQDKVKLAADIEMSRAVLGFSITEYIMFGFAEKSISERRKFISDEEKEKTVKGLNSKEIKDCLDSKYDTYLLLKDYYGRDMELMTDRKELPKFIDFCKRHPIFVKKDNFDSMGRGVEKVVTKENEDYEKLLERLTENGDVILLEELIEPHECIRKLNEDSVNTVRMVAIRDGNDVTIMDCFMKIGREGSFVDNGGAGGIFAHIDTDTGRFDSDGIDENGVWYVSHPDNGMPIKNYQLPNWDKAITTAKEIATKIDGLKYAGWDFTCDKNGQWIIVEGNSGSQFVAQQSTTQRGRKAELFSLIESIK